MAAQSGDLIINACSNWQQAKLAEERCVAWSAFCLQIIICAALFCLWSTSNKWLEKSTTKKRAVRFQTVCERYILLRKNKSSKWWRKFLFLYRRPSILSSFYFESVDGHSGFHTVCCTLHKNNTTDLNHNKFLQQINCGLPVRLKKIIKYIWHDKNIVHLWLLETCHFAQNKN